MKRNFREIAWSVLVLGLFTTVDANADVFAEAEAQVQVPTGNAFGASRLSAVDDIVHARAGAFENSFFQVTGFDESGPGALCGGGPLSCDGGTVGFAAEARAAAQANGRDGNLKVRATTLGNDSRAIARAEISDSVNFLTADRKLHVKVDLNSFGLFARSSGLVDLSLNNDFSLLRFQVISGTVNEAPNVIAQFEAEESVEACASEPCAFQDATILRQYSVARLEKTNPVQVEMVVLESGTDIPTEVEFDVDFSVFCVLGVCPDEDFDITMALFAFTRSDGDGNGARVFADNTTYLSITSPFTSLNGYQYLGISAIPLPAGLPLLGSGLALLGLSRLRGRFGRSSQNWGLSPI